MTGYEPLEVFDGKICPQEEMIFPVREVSKNARDAGQIPAEIRQWRRSAGQDGIKLAVEPCALVNMGDGCHRIVSHERRLFATIVDVHGYRRALHAAMVAEAERQEKETAAGVSQGEREDWLEMFGPIVGAPEGGHGSDEGEVDVGDRVSEFVFQVKCAPGSLSYRAHSG
jgi:hypothetical protein